MIVAALKKSRLIILLWTILKAINVVQIGIWLKSVDIERSVYQIIAAQSIIWMLGILVIIILAFCLNRFEWFTKWGIRSVSLNLLIVAVFGIMVPIGPSIVHMAWGELPLTISSFWEIYVGGTANILKDVSLYYVLMLSLSYGIHFFHEKKDRDLMSARLKEELVIAELNVLQSQLQPHFLFNALHSISSLMEENVKAAQNILVNLSELLRCSLEFKDTKFINLEEEVRILQLYLSIQRIRFSDSLSIDLQLDPGILKEMVPAFILQPLVENAFKHGMREQLELSICCEKRNDNIHILIRDNGGGFTTFQEGNGIRNVRTRLRALYDTASFEVYAVEDGVVNELVLPILNR